MSDAPKANIVPWPSDTEMTEAFEAYCLAVGKAAYEWNSLHEKLGELFAALADTDRDNAFAKWYEPPFSDERQRKMLKQLLDEVKGVAWGKTPRAKPDIRWMLKQIDRLADDRNNAVHMPASLYIEMSVGGGTAMGPAFMNGHPRAVKFKGKLLLYEFERCEASANKLGTFAKVIESAIGFPNQIAWPDRPKLLSPP